MALANLLPADDSIDELDSYMYQTVSLFFQSVVVLGLFPPFCIACFASSN